MRSGVAWRDLPERYGAWQTVYGLFRPWVESGLFERIFEKRIDDPDMEKLSLDSTIVCAHKKQLVQKMLNFWSRIKPLD